MSNGPFMPLELLPDWLVESPITFDDLKCTSAPSTIYRMSLPPPLPIAGHAESEDDARSIQSKPIDLCEDPLPEQPAHPTDEHQLEQDSRSFLWDLDLASDSDSSDDDSTLNEQEIDPSPIDPFFVGPPTQNSRLASKSQVPHPKSPSPAPTHASSFDCRSPWFMHFDAAALSVLDDQLLQSPVDAFADMCYAHAVQLQDPRAAPGAYSWRRFSRLRPLSPFSEESDGARSASPQSQKTEYAYAPQQQARASLPLSMPVEMEDLEEDLESDTDSEGLASPEQGPAHAYGLVAAARPRVYSPTPPSHHQDERRHARHYHQESDGSIQLPFRLQKSNAMVSEWHSAGSAKLMGSILILAAFWASPIAHTVRAPDDSRDLRQWSKFAASPASTYGPLDATTKEHQHQQHHPYHHHQQKPLPVLPPASPSPSPPRSRDFGFGFGPDPDPDTHHADPFADVPLRAATASPPPLHLPSPAVSQAQLAFLFGSGSALHRPGESVHFFPAGPASGGANGNGNGKTRPRRGTALRISTATGAGGTWFQRIRAGFSPGA
ncbi:hypothetical protein C8Q80DRAFT_1118558 [Daedaleopsis nitida]|nr:hypothetical protein C8Q80DRAFT_1118558 [Daedaleopsis nitida]